MTPQLGITFSHRHLQYLGLDVHEALAQALTFQFSHLRLCVYWSEVESQAGVYKYSEIESLLAQCEQVGQPVILTVGVKAPRWPEFFWPDFVPIKETTDGATQAAVLHFLEQTVRTLRRYTCITHWQIENEPLDPSGPRRAKFAPAFLQQEVTLVRHLDPRAVVLTLWGNDLCRRGLFPQLAPIADVVGIDLYPKEFFFTLFGHSFYRGPRQSRQQLVKQLAIATKPIWITELQAEPWEKDERGYRSDRPGSISPEQLKKNILQAATLPVDEILLWGFEYWLWRAQQGDTRYLELMRQEIARVHA